MLHTTLVAATGLGLLFSLFAYGLRRWVNEPLLALVLGVLLGPAGLGWLDVSELAAGREAPEVLEVVAGLTLALALVSAGLELRSYPREHWRSLAVLIAGGTALMWGTSALLVALLVGLDPLPAILIGAVLAPTDPILNATVATGRMAREHVPEETRRLLIAESSVRHGLGLVWVLLPAFLLVRPAGEAWGDWLVQALLWKGLISAAAGGVVGYAAARAQRWSQSRNMAEAPTGPLPALLLALSLAVASGVELAGGDGVLSVLGAGLAFAPVLASEEDGHDLERQMRTYESLLKQVLQVPVFLLLGAALPWERWAALGWRGPALVVAVLLLRRVPALLLLKPATGQLRRWDVALFAGWFGPVGVGALFFAAVAHKETRIEEVWTVATLVIAATIVTHDLTTGPFSRWLGRRVGLTRHLRPRTA